jgi:hypothetical protein
MRCFLVHVLTHSFLTLDGASSLTLFFKLMLLCVSSRISSSYTAVLHVGASEIINICTRADEPDLLRDIIGAQEELDDYLQDEVEAKFSAFSRRGKLEENLRKLTLRLMDVMVADLGFKDGPLESIVPYILSDPRGMAPN